MKRFLILTAGLLIVLFFIVTNYFKLFEKDYLIYNFSPLEKRHYFLFFGDEYMMELKDVKYSYLIDVSNTSNEVLKYEYRKGVEFLIPLFKNNVNGELFSFLQFKEQGINFYQGITEMKYREGKSDFVWFQSFYIGGLDSLMTEEHRVKRDSLIKTMFSPTKRSL
jgi:hypothetical protein